jgi:hypothetical protein
MTSQTRTSPDRGRAGSPRVGGEKCEFKKSLIEYLRVIISHNHVEMDRTLSQLATTTMMND